MNPNLNLTAADIRRHDMLKTYHSSSATIARLADRAPPEVIYDQYLHHHPLYRPRHHSNLTHLNPLNGTSIIDGKPVFTVAGFHYEVGRNVPQTVSGNNGEYMPIHKAYGHYS